MSTWQTVRYRDRGGVLRKTELQLGNEMQLPGAALPACIVTNPAGATMIQKWVPQHVGDHDTCSYDLLDAEIRAGIRLSQMYGDSDHPTHFPLTIGYNVDVAEPFVLLEPYRGVPLTPRRLDLDELREFAISLLRALQQIADAGMVHEAVRLASLRWDSQARFLQLVDFEHSLRHGDPRRPLNTIPDLSQEQAKGTGRADVRDDIWGAGITIRQLAMGPYANGAETLPAQVQTLLHGVFADTAAARPHAMELLARLNKTGSINRAVDPPDAILDPGRQLFEQVNARKNKSTPPQDRQESTKHTTPPVKHRRTSMLTVTFLSLLLIVASLLLLVIFR